MNSKFTGFGRIGALLALLLLQNNLTAGTYHETVERVFDLRRGGEVIIENTNGEVVVEAWDRDEVKVFAEKQVRTATREEAEEIMQKIQINFIHRNDYLRIETEFPRLRSGFWESFFGRGRDASVTYHLNVPRDLDLEVSTVNGKVIIREVSGQVDAHTTNGSIRILESRGHVNAKTTNGGIEVELNAYNENEDMTFKTTNGGIEVSFPRDFRASIDAKTTNGSIKTDFPVSIQGELSRKRLRGEINGGGGRIILHSTNGGIKISEIR